MSETPSQPRYRVEFVNGDRAFTDADPFRSSGPNWVNAAKSADTPAAARSEFQSGLTLRVCINPAHVMVVVDLDAG